jgi:tetratricopeptide (TPR) repeat protein
MKTKACVVTALFFVSFACAAYSQADKKLFTEAKGAEAAGKKDLALLLYRQILQLYPNSTYVEESHFLVGEYHYDSRNYFEADQTFRDFVKKFPQSRFNKPARDYLAKIRLRSLKDRADALFEEGKLAPASALYQQYLQVDPDNAEVKTQLEQITKTLQEVHFGFEQLHREQNKLELEKKEFARQLAILDEQKKEIEALQNKALEMNKATVEKYEKQLAEIGTQVNAMNDHIVKLQTELNGWRRRAEIAEAARLSQPLPRRFKSVPEEKELPSIAFEGGKKDPSLEEGEVQVLDVLREGFPAVVITQAKLDADNNVLHVEAVVGADLTSSWPEGAKMKFRVDFVGKEGQPAPEPAFAVRYYQASDMDEISEDNNSYKKRVVFTVEQNRVSRYEVSTFLVKSK